MERANIERINALTEISRRRELTEEEIEGHVPEDDNE